jgi:hypothetical protein
VQAERNLAAVDEELVEDISLFDEVDA